MNTFYANLTFFCLFTGGASVYQRVGEQHYYHHSHQVSDQNRNLSKSPSVFSSSSVTPHLVMSHARQPHSKIAKVIQQLYI